MKLKFSEDPKEWCKGAWICALGLAILSSLLRWRGVLPVVMWLVILAALVAIAVAAAAEPRWFRGFHRFSMRLGFAVSQLAGRIILAFFFIVVVTPVAIIRRALGKDPLVSAVRQPKLTGPLRRQKRRWTGCFELSRIHAIGAGWDHGELTRRRKGDKHKVNLARRLRAETTMSLAWVAQRLQMGS